MIRICSMALGNSRVNATNCGNITKRFAVVSKTDLHRQKVVFLER